MKNRTMTSTHSLLQYSKEKRQNLTWGGYVMTTTNEEQYLKLCKHVLKYGQDRADRTKTGTRSVFGYQMRFDLTKSFPLLTTKRIPFRLIVSELLWFLKGDTNIRYQIGRASCRKRRKR